MALLCSEIHNHDVNSILSTTKAARWSGNWRSTLLVLDLSIGTWGVIVPCAWKGHKKCDGMKILGLSAHGLIGLAIPYSGFRPRAIHEANLVQATTYQGFVS